MESPHPLKCAETWASNQSTSSAVEVPGLRVWVHATAFGEIDAGGDVHYVSVCPSCIVSRIALADVSGHGRAVEALGVTLRELMQTYLAELEQTSLMRDLNDAVMQRLDGIHYATMVAAGFHGRRGLLVMTNAGHPPAMWYRSNRRQWEWFEPRSSDSQPGASGTPLGLLPNASYTRMIVKPAPGDLVVLYSDGISEATNPDGQELGRPDLMKLAETIAPESAETFGQRLVDAVRQFRGGRPPEDDETVIVLQRLPATASTPDDI
jgi:sigma-B regulation protein RsbU (phosphoserine phosphatase)